MSHFSVAVFTDNNTTVEELLAPYQENNMGDCLKEYLEFIDITEENFDEYNNGGCDMVQLPDGKLVYTWDDMFRKQGSFGFGNDTHEVPSEYKIVHILHKERYKTFEEFMEDWVGESKDEETGEYGYWENPNAKWDWYEVGGRFSHLMNHKNGYKIAFGKISEIDFTPDVQRYNYAKRFWELKIEKDEPQNKSDEDMIRFDVYKDEYYTNMYKSKEEYADAQSSFETYAVITPDGEWHSKGDMGWWGFSSESAEEARQWGMSFAERFINNANPELILTIVDCHI